MLKLANVLIRLIGAVHLTTATAYNCFGNTPQNSAPVDDKLGGKAKYLTFWANVASAFYFWLALINDIISGCKDDKDQLLKKIKDFMFFSSVLPLTIVVTLLFWGLYAVNRELIFPERAEQHFPSWLNHSLHTAIFFYAILELLTSYHKPSSKKSHLLGVTVIFGAYAAWLHIIYFLTGCWIYPVLCRLNWFGREILTAVAGLIAYGAFFLGLYVNYVIWRSRLQVSRCTYNFDLGLQSHPFNLNLVYDVGSL